MPSHNPQRLQSVQDLTSRMQYLTSQVHHLTSKEQKLALQVQEFRVQAGKKHAACRASIDEKFAVNMAKTKSNWDTSLHELTSRKENFLQKLVSDEADDQRQFDEDETFVQEATNRYHDKLVPQTETFLQLASKRETFLRGLHSERGTSDLELEINESEEKISLKERLQSLQNLTSKVQEGRVRADKRFAARMAEAHEMFAMEEAKTTSQYEGFLLRLVSQYLGFHRQLDEDWEQYYQ